MGKALPLRREYFSILLFPMGQEKKNNIQKNFEMKMA